MPSKIEVTIDSPVRGTIGSSFTVSGTALDRGARVGPGVDVVNIWAFPNPGSGQGPVFLGSAGTSAGGAFELAVEGLGPGPYDLAVYPHSTVTGQFGAASAVRVRVK